MGVGNPRRRPAREYVVTARGVEPALTRGIGRFALAALVANVVIGAGILGLPGRIYALAGGWSVVLILATAGLVGAFALCFAELASRFDRTGGPYLYVATAFGDVPGFATGWLLWVSRVLTIATQLGLLAEYAGAQGTARTGLIVVVTGVLTLLTMSGARPSARTNAAITVVKLGLLLGLAALCLPQADVTRLLPGPAPTVTAASDTMLLLLFAFFGFEVATVVAGETRDPQREMPRGLLAGVAIVALVYVLVIAGTIGVLPDPTTRERAVLVAAAAAGGGVGAGLALAAALVVLVGALASAFLLAPRLLFALAAAGQLPRTLARLSQRRRTPDLAIAITTGAATLLAIFSGFLTVLVLATAARLLIYIACCLALVKLRRSGPPAGFLAPGGPALAIGSVAASGVILAYSARQELAATAAVVGAGLIVLAATRRAAR